MAESSHIVLLPWLAFGHMLPFLELGKRLAARGIHVSFISTHKNIKRLPPLPPDLESHFGFVEIPLPQVEGLQGSSEATIDIPVEQVPFLKMAYDGLKPRVEKLLEEMQPDLVICDFVSFWVPEIAAKHGVLSAYFSVFSAATLAFGGPPEELRTGSQRRQPEDLMVSPEWFTFPSSVAHRGDRARKIHASLNAPDESGMSSGQRMAETIEGCDFVTLRSCKEFEGEYITLLEKLYKKPVLPIVCSGWAPQLEILAHPAIGGSLFHAGWGSILESLYHGHALLLLPMIADQGLNARLLVDAGVAFEVERGADGVSFSRHEIAKSMKHVMVDPAGELLRQKAQQMKAIVANQELHEGYTSQFLQHFKESTKKKHLFIERC
ncbi:hypothetical protein H6P81_020357 [Aristolochia fimbriata]|uniref:UDP-rhamnose:rhamnosyltransferase 1 n=1 Tax=Aristolochia fimbriata TaxID=158543 RepID=A0AAV7DXF8_ARIFI|nr:hypothetical protein H6P81_020357 [Aristolochia fimbriata]